MTKKQTYYKAVCPDGTDFYTGTIDWAGALGTGEVIRHPAPHRQNASGYLSVSVSPTDCTGMRWPCRLLRVEPVGRVWSPEPVTLPNKRSAPGWRVVEELPATDALGPQGVHVVALIERCARLSCDEGQRLYAAWRAAGDAARYAARYAAGDAARYAARSTARYAAWRTAGDAARYTARYAAWRTAGDAAWSAAWDAAGRAAFDAAWALIVRDLIDIRHYRALTDPLASVIGPVHPDDGEAR